VHEVEIEDGWIETKVEGGEEVKVDDMIDIDDVAQVVDDPEQ